MFVGVLWGALVFPVIASFYWPKVTNKAFTVSVLAALAALASAPFVIGFVHDYTVVTASLAAYSVSTSCAA